MPRNKPNSPRVFCIGWHKTGTSTMGVALIQLGYTVLGARLDMAEALLAGDHQTPLEVAGQFDALQDVPWAALYKELDHAYPGSKFILTVRDEAAWLNSAAKHFKDTYFQLHEWLYTKGVLAGNEDLYLARYRKHYTEVEQYFTDRDNLLIMDFAAGDGWTKLCRFLGVPVPTKPFPHANKGAHNYTWKDKAVLFIQGLVPMSLRKMRVDFLVKMGWHKRRNQFNNYYQHKAMREKNKPKH